MSSLPVYVGLDYHQDSIQVCILSKDGKQLHNRSVANDAAAVRDVAQRFGEPRRIAIEACCGSADLAAVGAMAVGAMVVQEPGLTPCG